MSQTNLRIKRYTGSYANNAFLLTPGIFPLNFENLIITGQFCVTVYIEEFKQFQALFR